MNENQPLPEIDSPKPEVPEHEKTKADPLPDRPSDVGTEAPPQKA